MTPTTNIQTPLTDAEIKRQHELNDPSIRNYASAWPELSRTLERENVVLREALEEAKLSHEFRNRAEIAEAEVVELKHKLEESTGNYHFCANERDDNKAALSQLQQDVKPLVAIVKEVMLEHRDPDSRDYNDCDIDRCNWCEIANTFLLKHPELSQ